MTIINLLIRESPGFQKAGAFYTRNGIVYLWRDQIPKTSGYLPSHLNRYTKNIFFKSYIL